MQKKEHLKIWQQAFKNTITLNTMLSAAGTAYFALISIFPLILLFVAIASRWFDPMWAESEIITQAEFVIPGITNLLGANLEKIIEKRGAVTTSALLILSWSGSTLFSIVARVMDTIWAGRDTRSTLRYRGIALLFVIGLSLIVMPLLLIGTWITPLTKGLLPNIPHLLIPVFGFAISALGNILLFGLLYRFLPHGSPAWRDVWIAALASGILWEAAKRLFLGYTATFLTRSNLIYGSVSTIIAFLIWVHISGLIFFFGAYLGVGYSRHDKEEREDNVLCANPRDPKDPAS